MKKIEILCAAPGIPDKKKRTFNELQVLGDCDRDANGKVVPRKTPDGAYLDNKQRRVTKDGYLIDPSLGVISTSQPNM